MKTTVALLVAAVVGAVALGTPPGRAVLAEHLGVGPYTSESLRPVRFAVVDRDGRRFEFSVPRAYLAARVGGGAFEPRIGERAVVLSVDRDEFEPCRLTEGCSADSDVELGFPYPYELGDLDAPVPGAEARESDVTGFSLAVATRRLEGAGAVSDAPRTESRRYRAGREADAPRMDCDIAVLQGVEGGVCRVAVRWRDGALIEMTMSARDRGRVQEMAERARTLFDALALGLEEE